MHKSSLMLTAFILNMYSPDTFSENQADRMWSGAEGVQIIALLHLPPWDNFQKLPATDELEVGLWRYWIFPYRGDAATNIAVWRLIARPPPPSKKNWRGRTCASAWSAVPKRLRSAEPQHIVAGVRFHWSREEMYFQLHSLHQHEREGACSRLEDLVFKLKQKTAS